MGKPHKYAGVVKAWADGAATQYFSPPMNMWMDAKNPSFDESLQWRIKPERVYPKSSLTEDECGDLFANHPSEYASAAAKYVADKAVERHIQDQEGKQ